MSVAGVNCYEALRRRRQASRCPLPSLLLLMPLHDLLRTLHLTNSHPGLMLVYTTFALPLAVWMLRNYLITIPTS